MLSRFKSVSYWWSGLPSIPGMDDSKVTIWSRKNRTSLYSEAGNKIWMLGEEIVIRKRRNCQIPVRWAVHQSYRWIKRVVSTQKYKNKAGSRCLWEV